MIAKNASNIAIADHLMFMIYGEKGVFTGGLDVYGQVQDPAYEPDPNDPSLWVAPFGQCVHCGSDIIERTKGLVATDRCAKGHNNPSSVTIKAKAAKPASPFGSVPSPVRQSVAPPVKMYIAPEPRQPTPTGLTFDEAEMIRQKATRHQKKLAARGEQ